VRGRAVRSAFALSSAALVAFGVAGCQEQASSNEGATEPELRIVELIPIDQNGAEVKPPEGSVPADPAGDGKAVCNPVSVAMAGALTGADAALGVNIKNGVQMAVDLHNAANPGCQVQLKTFDTEGDPQKATQVAPQIVDDAFTVALIGPAFSGETKATGQIFDQAGLVAATASATNVTLSQQGWKTFFRGLSHDGVQGTSVANYLKNNLGYKKICVIDDSTDYGLGLAAVVRGTLGPAANVKCEISVKKGDKDFSAAVNQIKGVDPEAVFYSGYYAEAAPFVQQLRDGGFTGTFATADGAKDPQFVSQAGAASKDAILSCPCSPATGDFATKYKEKFGEDAGTYSLEGYDLGTILLKGIDAGKVARADLLEWVRNYQGQGVARKYQWTDGGELTESQIWIYKVQ
jgi:branched-chain amino acid transport system substrate-binding protein